MRLEYDKKSIAPTPYQGIFTEEEYQVRYILRKVLRRRILPYLYRRMQLKDRKRSQVYAPSYVLGLQKVPSFDYLNIVINNIYLGNMEPLLGRLQKDFWKRAGEKAKEAVKNKKVNAKWSLRRKGKKHADLS